VPHYLATVIDQARCDFRAANIDANHPVMLATLFVNFVGVHSGGYVTPGNASCCVNLPQMIESRMIAAEASRVRSTCRIWCRQSKKGALVTLLSGAAHPFALVRLFEVI